MHLRNTPEVLCCLNIGCGNHYSKYWNNIDLFSNKYVTYHDLKNTLPYRDRIFDFAYSSHLLEHLSKKDGQQLVSETLRVLKPRGIIRLAVPNLEKICKEYLKYLNKLKHNITETNKRRYEWILLELIDQMTREKPGGMMRELLLHRNIDMEYVESRIGDMFREFFASTNDSNPLQKKKSLFQRFSEKPPKKIMKAIVSKILLRKPNPGESGERHKWMYDRISLQIILEVVGFVEFEVKKYNESNIQYWDKYNLDQSSYYKNKPRKPDSIFVEAVKPSL